MSLALEYAYYSPTVSVHAYEWMYQAIDAFASVLDFYVLFGLAYNLEGCGVSGMAAIIAIAWHQLVKLQWHWAADMFRAPVGYDAVLTPLRAYSSWIVLLAFAWVSYCEGCAHRAKENT